MLALSGIRKFMFTEERIKVLSGQAEPSANKEEIKKPFFEMPRSKPPPSEKEFSPSIKTVEKSKEKNDKHAFVKIHSLPKSDIFFPREKDKLFWCFYIMKHGIEGYLNFGTINIVIEKKLKIEYIELLRNKKQLLKDNKIAPLSHVENFLLNEFRIDMKTFLALCVYENLNMIHVHKNTYYELLLDDHLDENSEVHIITRFDEPLKYGYKLGKRDSIKDLYKIENLNKPIKAMTSYKLDELVDICKKLKIVTGLKKENKKDFYEYIVQAIS
jgi:hypothetical protein